MLTIAEASTHADAGGASQPLLLRRLAADRGLPPGARIRLGLLLAYLAMPFDLIPNFIPVPGYAIIVIAIAVLRSTVRRAGTDDGFATLSQLAGLG